MAEYLQAMDIFAFPSQFEGLSVSLLEAQANGMPCLISNTIDPKSIVNDQVYTLPIESNCVDQWVNRIVECSGVSKRVNTQDFRDRGFDIKEEAKKLCDFFDASGRNL